MTSRQTTPSKEADSVTLQLCKNPSFAKAVNRLADFKVREAIRIGRLQIVPPNNKPHLARYIPRMDLIDDPSSPKVIAVFEIPGIRTSDLSLKIKDGELVILGDRKFPRYRESQPILHSANDSSASADLHKSSSIVPVQELRFGTFHRAIRVPEGTKDSDVSATLQDGMLTVMWPRSPATVDHTMSTSTSHASITDASPNNAMH